jgi:hypothetical protein
MSPWVLFLNAVLTAVISSLCVFGLYELLPAYGVMPVKPLFVTPLIAAAAGGLIGFVGFYAPRNGAWTYMWIVVFCIICMGYEYTLLNTLTAESFLASASATVLFFPLFLTPFVRATAG